MKQKSIPGILVKSIFAVLSFLGFIGCHSHLAFRGYVFADTLSSFAVSDSLTPQMTPRTPLAGVSVLLYSEVEEDSTFSNWAAYSRTEASGWFNGDVIIPSLGKHIGAFVVSRNTYYTDTAFFVYSSSPKSWNFRIGLRKIDDPMIERAQTILAIRDSTGMAFRPRSLADWKDSERFLGYIASPMLKTKFYLFTTGWMSPGILSIFCSYLDTLIYLPRNTSGHYYVDTVLIDFLNQRLLQEAVLDSQSVLGLSIFYNNLVSAGEESNKVLFSWRDIVLSEGQTMPEEVKNSIRPPEIIRIDGGYCVTMFLRNIFSAETLRIAIEYKGKIAVESKLLGRFGPRAFKM